MKLVVPHHLLFSSTTWKWKKFTLREGRGEGGREGGILRSSWIWSREKETDPLMELGIKFGVKFNVSLNSRRLLLSYEATILN